MSELLHGRERSHTLTESRSFLPLKRTVSGTTTSLELASEDFTPLTRAFTFAAGSSHSKKNIDWTDIENVNWNNAENRRHFNSNGGGKGNLKKAMSLEVRGMGTRSIDDDEEVSNQDNLNAELNGLKVAAGEQYIVVVDTFSTGAMLASKLMGDGYKVICVMSSSSVSHLMAFVAEGLDLNFEAVILRDEEEPVATVAARIQSICQNNKPFQVVAGAETGVELADALSEHFELTTNGTNRTDARRNKYVMGETIRLSGIRAVRQLLSSNWKAVQQYVEEWNPTPFKVILKPMDSAGSDGVTLCLNMDELRQAFGDVLGKVNALGLVNEAILVQEFLEGDEFVIDMVSRDGVHKCIAVWLYDRRPVNGAGFVAFGQHLLTPTDDPRVTPMIEYQKKVLTALGINNGPSHGEVKWFNGEPCLVEVGARCHGAEGFWVSVADAVHGYNQVGATIQAYCRPQEFQALPSVCDKRKAYGRLKFIISYDEGLLKSISPYALAEIKGMSSYRGHQLFVAAGENISKTQNCLSWAGSVLMVNRDEARLSADLRRIEELEASGGGLFIVQPIVKILEPCIIVVDPFSTGAVLASKLPARGYKVIALYSGEIDKLEQLKNLVPKGLELSFDAVLSFEKEDLEALIKNVMAQGWDIKEVIAGAETGVALCDLLSEALNLRTNNSAQSEVRRNKYRMGETIRNAGVRAVRQLRSSDWNEIETYLTTWNPSPFKCIVKPLESAGSDNVTLCNSFDEARDAFDAICGQRNILGLLNEAVLVQEFLEGQEFVVDMVSRDGVHKCVAVWQYDRRAVNGAGFVCFGQHLLTVADDPRVLPLVEYQKKVLTALGINNGPSHGEVKWFNGEPCLVEVGARCHGAEGFWVSVADAVHGYNQVDASVDAYTSAELFESIPPIPSFRLSHGILLFLIAYENGTYQAINNDYLNEITSMQSFRGIEIFINVGDKMRATVDCLSFAGTVKLVHSNQDLLKKDHDRIRYMEENGLFVVSKHNPLLKRGEIIINK